MSFVGIVALLMLLGAAAVLAPWTVRTRSGPLVRAALLAALVSSGTVGVWGVIAETLLGLGSRGGLIGFISYAMFATIFYFELTIVQNILGLTILANQLLRQPRGPFPWPALGRGTLILFGILYGEAILVISALGWVALFSVLLSSAAWRSLPALLFLGRLPIVLHTMAVAGGVTAVSTLAALARRTSERGGAGIEPS